MTHLKAKRGCHIRLSKSPGSCLILVQQQLKDFNWWHVQVTYKLLLESFKRTWYTWMTTPDQSGALFMHERVFSKSRGLRVSVPFFLDPPPPHSFHLFALAPFFARLECERLIPAARILFASYRNACYAGYMYTYLLHLHVTTREGYKLEAKSTPATSTCRFKARHNFTFFKEMDWPNKMFLTSTSTGTLYQQCINLILKFHGGTVSN